MYTDEQETCTGQSVLLPSVSALDNFCSSFLFLLFESPFIFEDLPKPQ